MIKFELSIRGLVALALLLSAPIAVAAVGGTGSRWFGNQLIMADKLSATSNAQSCTLNAGTPSTCTVTVTASAKCFSNHIGTGAAAAVALAVNLVTTTLTVTAANGTAGDVNVWCDR